MRPGLRYNQFEIITNRQPRATYSSNIQSGGCQRPGARSTLPTTSYSSRVHHPTLHSQLQCLHTGQSARKSAPNKINCMVSGAVVSRPSCM